MRLFSTCCGLLLSTATLAQPLRTISPEQAGFSKEGLARIDKFFEREIQADRVPGAVVAIARDGRLVYYKAHGFLNKATGEPMPLDAIFNLASMTKIMAAVGGLALNEQGRLPLKSRLDQYFPAFAKMTVGAPGGPDSKGEDAHPIYIHDLFRHTSGIPYGGRGNTPVQKLYPSSSASAAAQYTGEELIAKLSSLPLLHQPGTVWEYGFSMDVLGLVIEKVSGKRLDDYLRAVVWDKVVMPDTGFRVPPEKRKRLARPLPKNPIDGKDQSIAILDQPVKFDCAGSCAFSTVGPRLEPEDGRLDDQRSPRRNLESRRGDRAASRGLWLRSGRRGSPSRWNLGDAGDAGRFHLERGQRHGVLGRSSRKAGGGVRHRGPWRDPQILSRADGGARLRRDDGAARRCSRQKTLSGDENLDATAESDFARTAELPIERLTFPGGQKWRRCLRCRTPPRGRRQRCSGRHPPGFRDRSNHRRGTALRRSPPLHRSVLALDS